MISTCKELMCQFAVGSHTMLPSGNTVIQGSILGLTDQFAGSCLMETNGGHLVVDSCLLNPMKPPPHDN